MAEWYFRPKRAGELNREPMESEFFTSDAISEPGMALVREAIQNSLDARRTEEATVLVRISLSGEGCAAPAEQVAACYEGARGHLEADQNGLRRDQLPASDQPCPYVVIEDFGTTGLEGDTSQAFRPPIDVENRFYHFFRAEGQSDKEASDRGSWGVGKCVFTQSSRINCVFGLTVRADDERRLMMGKISLKSHWLDGHCCQDGFFGVPPELDSDSDLVMPIEDASVLDDFCDAFDLQRGMDTGLSVIVPWPWEDITQEQIVSAVLRDYFWPILAGQLEILIETPNVEALLDSGSILDEASNMAKHISEEHIPLLELAKWAIALPEDQRTQINLPNPNVRLEWSSDLIPPEAIESLREAFEGGQSIAVRVPVTVRPKDGLHRRSFLDAYIRREPTVKRDRPAFVRDGLIIPNVNAPRTRGVLGIVVVEDGALAEFLRDAENPAHTEWQHKGSNFDGKYVSGSADLGFVKQSVQAIVRILTESDRKKDETLLVDIFSLPDNQGGLGPGGNGDKGDDVDDPRPPIPPSKPQPFRIGMIEGGFNIVSAGPNGPAPPKSLEVRVGYDTRHGDPLKRYNTYDFRLDRDPIEVDVEGLDITEMQENHMRVDIEGQDFRLTATGFDPNRDLYVRVVGRQDEDAS